MRVVCFAFAAFFFRSGQAGRSEKLVREGRLVRGCASMPTNKPVHLLSKSSGLALSVASTDVGTTVGQSSTSSTNKLEFEPTSNNYYRLVVQHSDMAIGAEDPGLAKPGTVSQQPKTTTDPSIEWCFVPISSGVYQVENRRSGLVLEVENFNATNGGNIRQWKSTKAPNQLWHLGDTSVSRILQTGGWGGYRTTKVIAAAAANLPDGRILMWSAASKTDFAGGGGKTFTATYNPTTGVLSDPSTVNTNHDMFCPGTAMQAGGILITGGSDAGAATYFNFKTNKWSSFTPMNIARGYHSMTVLANDSVFTCGGSWSGGEGGKHGERWRYNSLKKKWEWQMLNGIKDWHFRTSDKGGVYRSDNHYWLFLAPNGDIFHAGPSKQMHWVTTTGGGSVRDSVSRGNDRDAMNGNAVMYDVGKILTIGGAPNYDLGTASENAYIIDINKAAVTVRQAGSMDFKRTLHNSVVLPSGEVVVVGGRTKLDDDLFTDGNAVLRAEIWSPNTEKFTSLGNMRIPRTYHSVALLTKDGRVFAAGGGLCGSPSWCKNNHNDFEILTPPYLLNSNGTPKTRPRILSAPVATKAGGVITVKVDTAQGHTFALVRLGAVTHSVNNDQRRIPLQFVSKNFDTFRLKVHSNANVALVGNYFLFAMNSAGVPSIAKSIRINI